MTAPVIDLPLDTAIARVPNLDWEFAGSGLRAVLLPPGSVQVRIECAAHMIDVNLNPGQASLAWNSDRMRQTDLPADSVAVAPLGTTLALQTSNVEDGLIIEVEPSRLEGLCGDFLDGAQPDWRLIGYAPDPVVAALGRLAIAEIRRPLAGPVYLEALSVAIAARCLAKSAGRGAGGARITGEDVRIRRAMEYAEANLARPLSLGELAGAACMSVFHFSRCFRLGVGQAPHAWLMARRVARARTMLAVGETPLAQVAYACGFASQSHFTSAFRARVGVTPGTYRKQKAG